MRNAFPRICASPNLSYFLNVATEPIKFTSLRACIVRFIETCLGGYELSLGAQNVAISWTFEILAGPLRAPRTSSGSVLKFRIRTRECFFGFLSFGKDTDVSCRVFACVVFMCTFASVCVSVVSY